MNSQINTTKALDRACRGLARGVGIPSQTKPDLANASALAIAPIFALDDSTQWLDYDQRPRLILDENDRLLWCNAAARRKPHAGSPFRLVYDRLEFTAPAHQMEAKRFIHDADCNLHRIILMPETGNHGGVVMGAWATGKASLRRVFVKLTLFPPVLDVAESGLAAFYELTPAESVILEGLIRLDSPTAIARRQKTSVHTVRTHVRGIHQKMGVRTQSQLICLSLIFCGG